MRLATTAARAADGLSTELIAVVDFFALDIVEALGAPGCALCRVLAETEARDMATFVREGRMVPEARARFCASGGFCPRHTWLFHRIAVQTAAGYAIADVYGMLIAQDLERLRGARRAAEPGQPPGSCPACAAAEAALARKADFFAEALADGPVRAAYAGSDGLCEPHLVATIAAANAIEPGLARYLVSDRRRRLEELAGDLAEYDRKRDHRYRHEPKGREQDAIAAVVRLYAGEPD